jgi:hypothetical protein
MLIDAMSRVSTTMNAELIDRDVHHVLKIVFD